MKQEIKDYFDSERISQSDLKIIGENPRLFRKEKEQKLYFEENRSLILGSAIDCFITQGEKSFEDEYYVSTLENKPSELVMSIINMVFDEVSDLKQLHNIHEYYVVVLEACNFHEYQKNWKDDTRVNKICEYWEYWEELKKSKDKIILSKEEYNIVLNVKNSILNHKVIGNYFIPRALIIDSNKNIIEDIVEIQYQKIIYFKYEGVECKAMMDMLYIDHENKFIQPIDIKTTSDTTLNFYKSLRKFGYYIQAAFYTEAIKYIQENENFLKDYRILPFKFIVESVKDIGTPLVYTIDEDLLEIGKYGKPSYETINYKSEEILGFDQLIELYKYYKEKGFNVKKEIVENNYEFIIGWNGIM